VTLGSYNYGSDQTNLGSDRHNEFRPFCGSEFLITWFIQKTRNSINDGIQLMMKRISILLVVCSLSLFLTCDCFRAIYKFSRACQVKQQHKAASFDYYLELAKNLTHHKHVDEVVAKVAAEFLFREMGAENDQTSMKHQYQIQATNAKYQADLSFLSQRYDLPIHT